MLPQIKQEGIYPSPPKPLIQVHVAKDQSWLHALDIINASVCHEGPVPDARWSG